MNARPGIEKSDAVQIVNVLLQDAIVKKASDIHLQPTEYTLRVRFRIDGALIDQKPISSDQKTQVISRLKVLSHLDIAEKRVPQDGKFSLHTKNQRIDLRVSTFPTLFGEKIVIRILDYQSNAMDLEQLGFSDHILSTFKDLINRQNGLLLVTGPTGSGKTTTLYAALSHINSPEKNIVTLEDPIEYSLPGIMQSQIYPAAGFTFEKGMRSLLRQDPDVIMVGEIRDKQTARIAIEAALTGHLVLSTLHTNDAPSAVMRLMDMGIEPYLINASLSGVLAQRLLRTICSECRTERAADTYDTALLKKLNISTSKLFEGPGCSSCNNLGYKGRTGIFELLTVTHPLRALIVTNPVFDSIAKQAAHDGMRSLQSDGRNKVKNGNVALNEVITKIL